MFERFKLRGIPWGSVVSVAVAGVIMASWGYYLLSSGSSAAPAPPAARSTASKALSGVAVATPQPTLPPPPQMSSLELKNKIEAGAKLVLLDARPSEDFAKSHFRGAISMPLAEVERRISEIPKGGATVTYGACL